MEKRPKINEEYLDAMRSRKEIRGQDAYGRMQAKPDDFGRYLIDQSGKLSEGFRLSV